MTLEERLRAALDPAAALRRPVGVDMSPEAITRRVRECLELSSLCLELAALGRIAGR